MGLCADFLVYFADNVLVIMVAAAAGTSPFLDKGPWIQSLADVGYFAFNFVLAIMIWAICTYKLKNVDDIDSEEPVAASIKWSHIISISTWLPRVAGINIVTGINAIIINYTKDDENEMRRLNFNLILCYTMILLLGAATATTVRFTEENVKATFFQRFIADIAQGTFSSTTGKACHFAILTMLDGVIGFRSGLGLDYPSNLVVFWTYSDVTLIMTVFCAASIIRFSPRLKNDTFADKVTYQMFTYVVLYTWAFEYVNYTWWLFYTMIGGATSELVGQLLFWAIIIICVATAFVFGRQCDGSFYGGPGDCSKGFGLMLCWNIEFAVWWGFGQLLTWLDGFMNSGVVAALLNLFVALILMVLTSTMYVYTENKSYDIPCFPQRDASDVMQFWEPDGWTSERYEDNDDDTQEDNDPETIIMEGT